MDLTAALEIVKAGGKVTSDAIAPAVLKYQRGDTRVVFEKTGSGYSFTPRKEHLEADWRKVEGWNSYV